MIFLVANTICPSASLCRMKCCMFVNIQRVAKLLGHRCFFAWRFMVQQRGSDLVVASCGGEVWETAFWTHSSSSLENKPFNWFKIRLSGVQKDIVHKFLSFSNRSTDTSNHVSGQKHWRANNTKSASRRLSCGWFCWIYLQCPAGAPCLLELVCFPPHAVSIALQVRKFPVHPVQYLNMWNIVNRNRLFSCFRRVCGTTQNLTAVHILAS